MRCNGARRWTCVLVAAALLLFACRRPNDNARGRINATVHLETFVLNVGDPQDRSFLRIGVDLGVQQPLQPSAAEQGNAALVPVARDTIISVLASAVAGEVCTPAGKAKLKGDLLKALQDRLPDAGIREIYFTEFLIQR